MMSAFFNSSILISIILFIGMLLMDYAGFRVRLKKNRKNITETHTGLGSAEGALLGLLSLLLAFTFNLSASRYDARRQTIIDEANDIGTAILRIRLYPDSISNNLNKDFKEYLEARIKYYETGNDEEKTQAALNHSSFVSQRIWNTVAALSQKPENVFRSQQMIPALNNMIDIATTRDDKE